jgi:hypothetical protein
MDKGAIPLENPNIKVQMTNKFQISKSQTPKCFGDLYFGLRVCLGFDAWNLEFLLEGLVCRYAPSDYK